MSKSLTVCISIITSIVLALANLTGAAGGGNGSILAGDREVRVSEATAFAGKDLDQDTYRLAWEMTAGTDRVEVRLFRGKRLLFAAQGRVVTSDSASPYDSVAYTRNGSGKLELAEIRFAGSRQTISLKDATIVPTGQP